MSVDFEHEIRRTLIGLCDDDGIDVITLAEAVHVAATMCSERADALLAFATLLPAVSQETELLDESWRYDRKRASPHARTMKDTRP